KEKSATKATPAQQPQRRGRREPQAPSWNRAGKRGLLLGLVVFAMFGLTSKGKYLSVLPLAAIYTVLFIPFTYWIDRFAYKRYLARTAADRKSTRLNSSHLGISYAVFCLKKKTSYPHSITVY